MGSPVSDFPKVRAVDQRERLAVTNLLIKIACELSANAVIHGPASGRVLVGYCLWREGARLVVCDGGGPSTPKLLDVGEQAEGGRGLHIVDSLTARWGTFRLAGVRAVWCDLGQPIQAASGDAWAWLNPVLAMRTLSAPDSQAAIVRPDTLTALGAR
jgi:hypothetical protein